ncbi:hypothetical protein [Micromonospora rhizosphaerae]|uniref:hypothetical protein n=1 Tax=Micromonospora rhizosphaerae TaxID=568872 RepID=UPI00159F0366|nr:hypothetical protein [Micromonospora rhizosphaerae]
MKSLAEEAAQGQVAPVARQASAADTRAQQADDKAQQAVDAVAPGASPSPTPTVRPGVPAIPDGGQSSSRRLSVTAGAGAIGTDRYTVPSRRVFVLTDIFLQNPQGDEGRLDLVVDGRTVLTVALANFRDLDYHMVSPIEVSAGRVISLRTNCRRAPGPRWTAPVAEAASAATSPCSWYPLRGRVGGASRLVGAGGIAVTAG